MNTALHGSINQELYSLQDPQFSRECKQQLDDHGVLVLDQFIQEDAIASLQEEGRCYQHLAYYTANAHNIYVTETDPTYAQTHVRNREVNSSKGCITTDQIPEDSILHTLYTCDEFRSFLCAVLGESMLYAYADPLSSINLHFASKGQELGWHFDNSSFAITLMVQAAEVGGVFEYVTSVRNADAGEMGYALSKQILDGNIQAQSLALQAGSLVLFRGRDALHRVTPVRSENTRMLAVLAYNTEPNVSLSESARMTFYGRLT